jgi:hypothetical protein
VEWRFTYDGLTRKSVGSSTLSESGKIVASKNRNPPRKDEALSSYGLSEIDYWIYTSRDKFDVPKFCAAVGTEDETSYDCTLPPRDSTTDYCLHIGFVAEEKKVTIQLGYLIEDKLTGGKGMQYAYAEEAGDWLGQFFKYDNTQGHMHAHFSYPLATRQSKFPLPLKTSIQDAEIDGISLRLPDKPEGVLRVRLTSGKEDWYVEVIADRRITFKGFTPHSDISALASVVSTLLEERKS